MRQIRVIRAALPEEIERDEDKKKKEEYLPKE